MPGVASSEPFNSGQRPSKVVQEGLRLDGRGFEEFRPVCKAYKSTIEFEQPRRVVLHIGEIAVALQSST